MKQYSSLSASLDLCQALYAIVGAYPKRVLLFEDVQKDFKYEKNTNEYKVFRLQSLSATRWTTRVKAADVIFEKTAELRTILEMLKNDPSISADTKMRFKGILKSQLSSLEVLFDFNVTRKLVCLLEKFSKELQAIDISADYALYSLQHILQRLDEMRSERELQHILNEARNVPGMEENCERGRRREIPRWIEYGDSVLTDRLQPTDTAEDDSIDQMRRSYHEASDVIVQSVNERFEQKYLSSVRSIEQILLRSMIERGCPMDSLTHALIDKNKLRMQVDDLPTILGLYNVEQKKKILAFQPLPTSSNQCPLQRNSAPKSTRSLSCTILYPSPQHPVSAHLAL